MNIVYAGTQKAASSWLNVVCRESGLDVPPRKEWHFWNRALGFPKVVGPNRRTGEPLTMREYLDRWAAITPDLSVRLEDLAPLPFRDTWPSGGRHLLRRGPRRPTGILRPRSALHQWTSYAALWHIGDFTPENAILTADHWREIARRMPKLRVVIGVRNPVRRAWSGLSMYFRDGQFAPLPTPDEAVEFVETSVHRRMSYQSEIVRGVRSAFHEERILIVAVDDIVEDTDGVLRRFGAFVGRTLRPVPPVRAAEQIPPPRDIEAALTQHLAGETEALESAVGRRLTA